MEELIQQIKIFDESELKKINDYIDSLSLFQNMVFDSKGKSRVDTSMRSSLGCTLNETHEITKIIHEKMNESLLIYKNRLISYNDIFNYYPIPGAYSTNSHRESIQVLEYNPNQEYKFHHDVSNDPNSKEYHRKISIVAYLNGNFEGGGTEFIHRTYKPSPGYCLIFPSSWCFPHSGQKVLNGKKRVAVTWYYVNDSTAIE